MAYYQLSISYDPEVTPKLSGIVLNFDRAERVRRVCYSFDGPPYDVSSQSFYRNYTAFS